jgi:hypothetical protein
VLLVVRERLILDMTDRSDFYLETNGNGRNRGAAKILKGRAEHGNLNCHVPVGQLPAAPTDIKTPSTIVKLRKPSCAHSENEEQVDGAASRRTLLNPNVRNRWAAQVWMPRSLQIENNHAGTLGSNGKIWPLISGCFCEPLAVTPCLAEEVSSNSIFKSVIENIRSRSPHIDLGNLWPISGQSLTNGVTLGD